MKRASVSVTNDLATDQRVIKVCDFLTRLGYKVTLIGIKKSSSAPVNHIRCKTFRFRMAFSKGFLFYAEYNIKLFFFLFFRRNNLLVSNDLDTLLPNFLMSRLRFIPLVYDSHEYFLGSTEIEGRPWVKRFWASIEKSIFPKLKKVITVNHSIADLYEKDYGIRPIVVRNLPKRYKVCKNTTRSLLGLPTDKKIVLMQGGAINIDRGAEELITAMKPQYGLDDVVLYFIGSGEKWEYIKTLAHELHLERKVYFLPRMPYHKMMQYTCLCDLGVSLDKPVSINYKYSLPNKLFDYLAAGIPVLASPMVEVKKVVESFKVGMCIENHEPEHIAKKIREMLSDNERLELWKKNALKAAGKLCWENEEKILINVYKDFA